MCLKGCVVVKCGGTAKPDRIVKEFGNNKKEFRNEKTNFVMGRNKKGREYALLRNSYALVSKGKWANRTDWATLATNSTRSGLAVLPSLTEFSRNLKKGDDGQLVMWYNGAD